MAASQFDKDFGYLMPFLDKVAAAASELQDTAAREELIRLVAEEKQQWARIRQLLSGAQATSKSLVAANAAQPEKPTIDNTKDRPTFTVGSLRSPAR